MIFVIMLIFAVACALIASSKGRSPVGWFFIGLFITWIGLVLVLVLPNVKERQRVDSAARADRRRLREQLRQERLKNEAYRRHAASRLDLHDRALGMDTRQAATLPAGHGLQQPLLDEQTARGSAQAGSVQAGSVLAGSVLEEEALDSDRLVGVPPPPPAVSAPAEWHYERHGKSEGPVTARAVRLLVSKGRLEGTSLVWREGMDDWRPVSEVPQFRASFQG